MPITSSQTLPDANVQANGTRKVAFYVQFHTGEEKTTSEVGYINYPVTPASPVDGDVLIYAEDQSEVLQWNGSSWDNFRLTVIVPREEVQRADVEYNSYRDMLISGVDVFDLTPDHQTGVTLFTSLLNEVTQLSIMELFEFYQGIGHINGLNKPVAESYGMNWQDFSSWTSAASTLKVAIDNYVPITP